MLDEDKIKTIARQVATANLSIQGVQSIFSAPTIDSEGHDALRIVIALTPGSTDAFKGDAALNILVQMTTQLQEAGESRFPIVEYTQGEDEEEGGTPQS